MHLRKPLVPLVFAAAASAAALSGRSQIATVPAKPKLVVLVVVDQMRADYLQRYDARISAGFRRVTSGGAVFTQAFYPYASTETAQGHSLMSSGQSPSVSGIVGDTWYDRQTRTTINAGESLNHLLIGGAPRGGSPEQLLVHTVGDAMKQRDPHTIVMTTSWKRYSAVLMGGQHADAAFWLDEPSGRMVTSDYYRRDYPAWVDAFNAADPTGAFFGKEWLGHKLGTDAPNAAFRLALRYTPYANGILLDFATKLLINTDLGRDDVPDLLGVSFSATDYAGHEYGPETPEFDETFLQVDRQLGGLIDALDQRVGVGGWTMALTADHGAALLPEKMKERGEEAGRIDSKVFRATVVTELSQKWPDAGPLITAFEYPEFYLDYAEAARRGIDVPTLERAVAEAAGRQPGVAQVYTRSQIISAGPESDPFLRAVNNGFHPARSGDIYVLLKPNFIFWGTKGTTHGTPYEYDQHVPLIFYGAGIQRGTHPERIVMTDLAPTLAALAGAQMIGVPGKALRAAFEGVLHP